MSLFMTILRHTVRRAAGTEPVFHASLTIRPFKTRQAYLVSLFVAVEVTVEGIISWDTPPSAATSIPMSHTNLPSLIIARVMSARIVLRGATASWSVVVLRAIHFQLKCHGGAPARKCHKLLVEIARGYPRLNGFVNIVD